MRSKVCKECGSKTYFKKNTDTYYCSVCGAKNYPNPGIHKFKNRLFCKHNRTKNIISDNNSNVLILFKTRKLNSYLKVSIFSQGKTFKVSRGEFLELSLSEGKQVLRFRIDDKNIEKTTTICSGEVTMYFVSWNGKKITIKKKTIINDLTDYCVTQVKQFDKEIPKTASMSFISSIVLGFILLIVSLSIGIKLSIVSKNKDALPSISPTAVTESVQPTSPEAPLVNNWMDYYSENNIEVVEVDSDVLLEYGAYYSNKVVCTAVSVSEINSTKTIIKYSAEEESFHFSEMLFYGSDNNTFSSVMQNDVIVIVGAVEKISEMSSTLILSDCHVIKTGDEAESVKGIYQDKRDQFTSYALLLKSISNSDSNETLLSEEAEYKSNCSSVVYNNVSHSIGSLNEKHLIVSGQVTQVTSGLFGDKILLVKSIDGLWYVYCPYSFNKDLSFRIQKGDILTFYGDFFGVNTVYSDGITITVPSINAKYVDINFYSD